jgi:hypothetical protein
MRKLRTKKAHKEGRNGKLLIGTRGTKPSLSQSFWKLTMLTRFWKLTNAHKMALKRM